MLHAGFIVKDRAAKTASTRPPRLRIDWHGGFKDADTTGGKSVQGTDWIESAQHFVQRHHNEPRVQNHFSSPSTKSKSTAARLRTHGLKITDSPKSAATANGPSTSTIQT